MKNILVLADDDSGREARLQAALDLGRATGGHVRLLSLAALYHFPDDTGGAMSALLFKDERERINAERARIEPRLADEEVGFDFIEAAGDAATELIRASELADLIVVNRALDDSRDGGDLRALTERVILKSGRPVLAVPQRPLGIDFLGEAMVAWDGSAQASAALRAAVPLLTLAGGVRLVEVDDGSLATPATEAATYLSRHGVHAEIDRRPAVDASAGYILLQAIEALRPSYLVMGAYGRSRLSEALFGGVSRRMLEECPIPLFLAH